MQSANRARQTGYSHSISKPYLAQGSPLLILMPASLRTSDMPYGTFLTSAGPLDPPADLQCWSIQKRERRGPRHRACTIESRTQKQKQKKKKKKKKRPGKKALPCFVCALSTGKISRAWIASLNFFSPQPLSWMCGVSYYASSAPVNPEYLSILPSIAMEPFGSRLYISAVPNKLARQSLILPFEEQRVASRLASPCPQAAHAPRDGTRVPGRWGQRAADVCVSGCPMSTMVCRICKFALLTLVTCAIGDTHTARYKCCMG
jgi:hypothetical protein